AQLPHAPDFDDYPLHHIEQFSYLLERNGPDNSLPRANYALVYDKGFFRVYRRTGPGPRLHVPMGTNGHSGGQTLECRGGVPIEVRAKRLVAQGAREGTPVTASLAAVKPRVVDTPDRWFHSKAA